MLTSLAPSPMDRVMAFLYFFTRLTTLAFCFGVTRQQITDSHSHAMFTKSICGDASPMSAHIRHRAPPPFARPHLSHLLLPVIHGLAVLGAARRRSLPKAAQAQAAAFLLLLVQDFVLEERSAVGPPLPFPTRTARAFASPAILP